VQGLWLALLLSGLGAPLLAFPDLWLGAIDPPAEVTARVTPYLRLLSLALPAALVFRAVFALNVAISRPRVMMALQLAGLLLKLVANDVFVFGRLGLPALGVTGCALGSLVVFWALAAVGWALTRLDPYRRFAIGFAWPDRAALTAHLRLGVPMGLAHTLEATSFTFMALLLAPLGTSVMAGHQIAMNLAAVCFQVPFALAVATATATAQAIGAGDPARARRTAFTGIRIGTLAAALTAAGLWTLRARIVALYTTDAAVAALALTLVPYLAAFHVFDAVQAITGFVLRAYKIAFVPTLIYAGVLWGLGLMGGYAVAFHPILGPPRGAPGMWLMQSVALGLTAVLLIGFYVRVLERRGAGRA
jgi:MATE family multidrug resistance protein